MEIRRVQVTGGSSYIITLPKDWIKSWNIQKNDPIGLLTQSNGSLMVTPKIEREEKQRVKEFTIKSGVDHDELFRQLIAAYITGYNTMQVKASGRIPPEARTVIREFIQSTIGQEVIEETEKAITLKDLVNPAEMPFHRTIKRMYIIVRGMLEDSFTSLTDQKQQLAEDIIIRDNEVDRLHWLIARQQNILQRNLSLAEKIGTSPEMATTYYLVSRIIERIGDHATRISKNVLTLLHKDVDEAVVNKISEGGQLSLEIFDKSLGALFRKNIHAANENIDSVENLESLCDEINAIALQQKGDIALSVGYIVDSIRRIGEYAEDISENVINHLVGQETES